MQTLAPALAFAVAHPHHDHTDWIGEQDLLLGFKVGPQLTNYTGINSGGVNLSVPSREGYLVGPAFQLVYGLPRFEVDALFSGRGGILPDENIYSVAVPVMFKIPISIDVDQDFFFGGGVQPEFVIGGYENRRSTMVGFFGLAGFTIDLTVTEIEMEVRYNFGIFNPSPGFQGGIPQDLQLLLGALWHL